MIIWCTAHWLFDFIVDYLFDWLIGNCMINFKLLRSIVSIIEIYICFQILTLNSIFGGGVKRTVNVIDWLKHVKCFCLVGDGLKVIGRSENCIAAISRNVDWINYWWWFFFAIIFRWRNNWKLQNNLIVGQNEMR